MKLPWARGKPLACNVSVPDIISTSAEAGVVAKHAAEVKTTQIYTDITLHSLLHNHHRGSRLRECPYCEAIGRY